MRQLQYYLDAYEKRGDISRIDPMIFKSIS
jgi:hypothetical protein